LYNEETVVQAHAVFVIKRNRHGCDGNKQHCPAGELIVFLLTHCPLSGYLHLGLPPDI
jgi:hypothetical protein